MLRVVWVSPTFGRQSQLIKGTIAPMIGQPWADGVVVSVTLGGKPIRDNHVDTKWVTGKATRKGENVCDVEPRQRSWEPRIEPPRVTEKVRYQGRRRCMNASVDNGVSVPSLSYEERKAQHMRLVLTAPASKGEIKTAPKFVHWDFSGDRACYALNPDRYVSPRVAHKPIPYEPNWDWWENCVQEMDRDQWQTKRIYRPKGWHKGIRYTRAMRTCEYKQRKAPPQPESPMEKFMREYGYV